MLIAPKIRVLLWGAPEWFTGVSIWLLVLTPVLISESWDGVHLGLHVQCKVGFRFSPSFLPLCPSPCSSFLSLSLFSLSLALKKKKSAATFTLWQHIPVELSMSFRRLIWSLIQDLHLQLEKYRANYITSLTFNFWEIKE